MPNVTLRGYCDPYAMRRRRAATAFDCRPWLIERTPTAPYMRAPAMAWTPTYPVGFSFRPVLCA